jgi:N-methylhydantoinase A
MTTHAHSTTRYWLGIDTGGTFTDFVLFDGRALRVHKVLSSPEAPERAILQGIAELGLEPRGLQIVHGSTVATNAVLEGKGVRTAYIANRGLGDVLTIGRQARRELYNLQPVPGPPPVPRELCWEVGARTGADGRPVTALTADDRTYLLDLLERLRPEAVAINLLFSWLDERDEATIASWLPDGLFIARSSAVLPEYREYERGIATWLNAWVGPRVAGYLARLDRALAPAPVAVMQSAGGTVRADLAGPRAVHLLLSGPAGGLMGARHVGRQAGHTRLLTFDMGGTSTDVALIDGDIRLTSEGRIGPWPVAVPMVDLHTIGAGGGSIAQLDAGGVLQVGPESAGARPGPACYGRGGTRATVTDANLVLGRLLPEAFLGGAMRLDGAAAHAVLAALAAQLGMTPVAAAQGVIAVANAHMAQALRVISVQRGIDPRNFVLVSFGGAGGLHVCALAEALGMRTALVPVQAGVLSALGMLAAPPGRQLTRTLTGLLDKFTDAGLADHLQALAAQGRAQLQEEGIASGAVEATFRIDLRYRGQSFALELPWQGVSACRAAFEELHERRYGHRLDLPVELVTLRCRLQGQALEIRLPAPAAGSPGTAVDNATVADCVQPVPVYARDRLAAGQRLTGPAIVTETVATTWLAPGWRCVVDPVGNLLLERGDG